MVIAVTKNSRSKEHNMQLTKTEKQHVNPMVSINEYIDDQIHPLVKQLNFDKLKWKLSKSAEASWSESLCDYAEAEYSKFLSLKKLYPKVALVPSKLVDKFWHEHILDTEAYDNDCIKVFGHFIHHYPYFGIYGEKDQTNLQNAFNETLALYETHFGTFPTSVLFGKDANDASRCGEHACHVSSDCACRVSGACK
jgi:hypothetical protein